MTVSQDSFVFPASFAQSRLWYIDQWQPHSPLYNMYTAFRISGPLDQTALQRSLNEIVRRHDSLRTTFIAPQGVPLQVVARAAADGSTPRNGVGRTVSPSHAGIELPVVDLSAVPSAEREARVQALARDEARTPFDLARGPLLRTTLLRLGPQEHVLLITIHHIVSDAWSMGIFYRELSALYDAFSANQPSPLPELPIQYADFSLWQRQWLQGEALQEQLAFWKQHLAGAPPTLELPTDRPRPTELTHNGARLRRVLPAPLAPAVTALSRRERVTPFMTLLSAFLVLLQRYTGQDDIVIGTPIANRTRVEIEGLIGFFVNTLALRSDLSGNPTFRQLLRRVWETALDVYDHQDLPFEKLVEELQPERRLDRTPLFQVLFQLDSVARAPLALAALTVQPMAVDSGVARVDLALTLRQEGAGLSATAIYKPELFDRDTVERLLHHYENLLGGIVANPDERIGYLPLLTAAERQRMLVEWNDTSRALPAGACVHDLFSAHAARQPDAPAIISAGRTIRYGELEARTNQLAHYLISLGLGPECPIALLLDRSIPWIIAMLGVLKAGAAYLPLDVDSPPQRLAFTLHDSGARLVLTEERWLDRLPGPHLPTLCLDRDWPLITSHNPDKPSSGPMPGNLAYVIYTSGSTGQPKGVMVTQRSFSNLVQWHIDSYDLSPGSRALHLFAASFDAASAQVFTALCGGATLYLASQEVVSDPLQLVRWMGEAGITHAAMPPALLDSLPQAALPALRTLIVGGEALAPELVERWAAGRRMWNAYGPTEVTVCATKALCQAGAQRVCIGRPDYNVQAYILDRHLQPVPVGVRGELYVSGTGLGRGYLGHPEWTAESFVPHPFSTEWGARLFKTGDLARYLPDGNIEFLGRSDFQVKMRGFRVELGEIETALRRHPAVAQAAVLAREQQRGDTRLVAYVVPRAGASVRAVELHDYLLAELPRYMVPDAFVMLDSMPLTTSGKLDRTALPPPEGSTLSAASFVAPLTPTEGAIAAVWQEVLQVERISRYDNFFDLGGHSLLAMQAMARMEQRLGLRLSPRDLVLQTLAQLAASCDERLAQGTPSKATGRGGGLSDATQPPLKRLT